mmetsp:Transcript_7853/g.16299  ORF Transcript_7853/g.16299 Transcript_7853/m.16299 type:complete len:200 (-) Transcript_7853:92-691(-)
MTRSLSKRDGNQSNSPYDCGGNRANLFNEFRQAATDPTYGHHAHRNYATESGHRYGNLGIDAYVLDLHGTLRALKCLKGTDAGTQGDPGDHRQGKPFTASGVPQTLVVDLGEWSRGNVLPGFPIQSAQSESSSVRSSKEIAHQISNEEHDARKTNPRGDIEIGVDDLEEANRDEIRRIHNYRQSNAPQDEHEHRQEQFK